MPLFVGIDGGATKTHVVISDGQGRRHGEGRAGASNYQIVGPSTAAHHLATAISAALGSANPAQVAGVVGGFAGLDGPGDYAAVAAFMTEAMESVGVVAPWWAVNDGVVAWAGALALQPGAIVVSGSGAIAFAVNASGASAHSDGLGHWLGDEGSGFDIGQRGLRAAMRALENRGPATPLAERVVRRHGEGEALDSWLSTLNGALVDEAHAQIADFARDVVEVADKGDAVAQAILKEAGIALAQTTASALHRVKLTEAPRIATVGSLFVHSPLLRDFFGQALREQLPEASIHWPQKQPAEGAALLARQPEAMPQGVVGVQKNA